MFCFRRRLQARLFCLSAILGVGQWYPVAAPALLFEPAVGAGVEYTDNAQKTPQGQTDVIVASYLGARVTANDGPFSLGLNANVNQFDYTKGSFDDQRYFNVAANSGWEMVKDRISWFFSDYYQQRPIRSINASRPSNLQNSNIATVGVSWRQPISARQSFSITPSFSDYYYEVLTTDNRQRAVNARWNFQWFRRTGIGLSFNTRELEYTQQDLAGNKPANTSFTNLAFLLNGVQRRSSWSLNLGSTNVKREGGREGSGFTGNLKWRLDMTSRSKFNLLWSTEITDTGSVTLSAIDDPINGNPDDVQLSTDVIRNTVFNAAYLRKDATLDTRLWWEFRDVKYSDSPLNREIRTLGTRLGYPVTPLIRAGLNAMASRTRQLDTDRLDKRYLIGANLHYKLSRKLFAAMDVSYRQKDSTNSAQSFEETAVFIRLVYGPGDVQRPSQAGGF